MTTHSGIFNNTKSLYFDFSALNTFTEEYNITENFNIASLVLSGKGYKPDPYVIEFRSKTFMVSDLTADYFEELSVPYSGGRSLYYGSPYVDLRPVSPVSITNYQHRPISRDFYRYLDFSITYPPNVEIMSVSHEAIVKSYIIHSSDNTVSVLFNDYNSPFSGKVCSIWIKTENGTLKEKVIRIGG